MTAWRCWALSVPLSRNVDLYRDGNSFIQEGTTSMQGEGGGAAVVMGLKEVIWPHLHRDQELLL